MKNNHSKIIFFLVERLHIIVYSAFDKCITLNHVTSVAMDHHLIAVIVFLQHQQLF